MKRFSTRLPMAVAGACQARTFFGKGWDNASMDVVYRHLLRKPEINDRLRTDYVRCMEPRTYDAVLANGKKADELKTGIRIFLPPHVGDPHRLLKAYSLTAYPILDEKGEQMTCHVDGATLPAFADPDDDYSKVCVPQLAMTEFLSQELLKALDWEATPRGAASLLESLYRGAEIPDHVFQTPAVIERQW